MNFFTKKIIKPFIIVSLIAGSTLYLSQSGDLDYYINELFEDYDGTEYDTVTIQYADVSEFRSGNDNYSKMDNLNNNEIRNADFTKSSSIIPNAGSNPPVNNYTAPSVNRQNVNYMPNNSQNNAQGSGNNYNQANRNNQAQLMTIVKCIQHADRIIGSAFMLPPGWQAQCNTQYDLKDNTLWSDPIIQAHKPNSNIQLFNDKSLHFYYNRQLRDQMISSKSLDGVDISVFGPEFARSHQANTQEYMRIYDATYPEALDLVHYASTKPQELTHLQGYKVYHISRDPISQNIRKIINNNNVTINVVTVIGHEFNNPNSIKMVKYIQAIIPIDSHDNYTWHLHPMMATGIRQDEVEMSKLINLVINTRQENPKFTRMLSQVNINMARQARKTYSNISNITAKTYSEINDIYHNTYKNISASSERSHSNWVDGMLEVENYVNPFDGKQVKMPMHNKYYFTNNLDDYLGTNNPLFNPNIDLNYLYNWRKLERI